MSQSHMSQSHIFGALELFLGVPFPLMSFNFLWKTFAFSEKKDYFCSIHIIIVSEDKNRQTMWNCQAELTI